MDPPPARCHLSYPFHPHFLSRRDNPPPSGCFCCGVGVYSFSNDDWHYYCDTCEFVFHKRCYNSLPGIRHPYHPKHLLFMTIRFSETEIKSYKNPRDLKEAVSKLKRPTSPYKSNNACDWCGKKLGEVYYRCLVCGFSLGFCCSRVDPPFTITNTRSHQHSLTLFTRPLLIPCSACGLDDKKEDPGYVCLLCNYILHKICIDLPRVIKLTRHPHRLSYIPYLPPPAKRSCGVCRRDVDVKRGMYSCNKGCSYAVHSRCATHKDIWDGVDVEEIPEEPIEDVAPFEEIGCNVIKYFSHEHYLRFNVDGLRRDANNDCEVCCMVVDSGNFYSCTAMHCDFILHATCANLPKKYDHPIHRHPLTLRNYVYDFCSACVRGSSGFGYKCSNNSCVDDAAFEIDVRCAAICEPFEHKVHPHPLFLFSGRNSSAVCGICKEERKSIYTLQCDDCEFDMCFGCATIPFVIRYKHDEHPLTLCGGEDSSDPYWCERCEGQIDLKKWFYTCNECCTTLHIDCVFGNSDYVRIGEHLKLEENGFIFTSNTGNSRPVCGKCNVRCLYAGFFKGKDVCLCSMHCLLAFCDLLKVDLGTM